LTRVLFTVTDVNASSHHLIGLVSGKYQPDVAPTLYKASVHITRGNDMRLEKSRVKYDLRKFSFF